MEKICVFLFSGTGMTRYIIDRMKAEFEKRQVAVDIFDIENMRVQDVPFQDYNAAGIAYPVHSFNAPKLVIDFAKRLPKVDPTSMFVVSTAGSGSKLNFASSGLLVRILRRKGFVVFYEKQFIMPSNFLKKDNEMEARQKIEKADMEIPQAAYGVLGYINTRIEAGIPAKIVAFIGRLEWFGARCIKLNAGNACDRCGICAGKCPNRNITMDAERAVFKWNCGLCMRCLYLCPKRAIRIQFPFGRFALEDWYENDELQAALTSR